MQTLIWAEPELAQQQNQINLSLGIVQPLQFPYNLFLNFSNLIDPDSRFVYFFVYELGAKRIVFWGIYDKVDQTFSIDGACRYAPAQLAMMVRNWKEHNVNYVANSVMIRQPLKSLMKTFQEHGFQFTGRQVTNLPSERYTNLATEPIQTYAAYLEAKFILGYYDNKISETELETRYPGLHDEFIQQFENKTHPSIVVGDYDWKLAEYLADLRDEVRLYEEGINRTDLDQYLLPKVEHDIQATVAKITQRFYEAIKTGQFETETYYRALSRCPDLQACQVNAETECSVYFYGDVQQGLVNPRDPRLLL
jgi:hypothetical protein